MLEAIPLHAHEKVADALQRKLADWVCNAGLDGDTRVINGACALTLEWGLPRPTRNLDFTVEGYCNSARFIERLASEYHGEPVKGWKLYQVPDTDPAHGRVIRARSMTTGETIDTELNLIPSGAFPGEGTTIDPEHIDSRDKPPWVEMWTLPELAKRKIATLVGERARHQPTDVYDIAFLMERHPEAVTREHWDQIAEWHKTTTSDPSKFRSWAQEFASDPIAGRVDFGNVLDSMEQSLRKRDLGHAQENLQREREDIEAQIAALRGRKEQIDRALKGDSAEHRGGSDYATGRANSEAEAPRHEHRGDGWPLRTATRVRRVNDEATRFEPPQRDRAAQRYSGTETGRRPSSRER